MGEGVFGILAESHNWGLTLDAVNALFPEGFHGLVRDWMASCVWRPLVQPAGVFRRAFLFLHLHLYVPLKRRYRLLDSFAIGIGLIVALVLASVIYQAVVGPNAVTIAVRKFYESWGMGRFLPRSLSFWPGGYWPCWPGKRGTDDNRLKTDDVTNEY